MRLQEFPRIKDVERIECLLEPLMQRARDVARGLGPPAFFGQSDAMFSSDHTAPGEDLCEQFIQRPLDPLAHRRILVIRRHDVDVNIAVARVTKSGDGKTVTRLQVGGELDQIDQPAPRHHNVLIQFR